MTSPSDDFFISVEPLHPCNVCGRTFRGDIVARHEYHCQRNTSKKRKTYKVNNIKKTGLQLTAITHATGNEIPEGTVILTNKELRDRRNNWRIRHENFQSALKSAKDYQVSKEDGILPPPPPPTYDPSLIQCPTCNRRFNEKAAQKHLSFCKERMKREQVAMQNRLKCRQRTERGSQRITDTGDDSNFKQPRNNSDRPVPKNVKSSPTSSVHLANKREMAPMSFQPAANDQQDRGQRTPGKDPARLKSQNTASPLRQNERSAGCRSNSAACESELPPQFVGKMTQMMISKVQASNSPAPENNLIDFAEGAGPETTGPKSPAIKRSTARIELGVKSENRNSKPADQPIPKAQQQQEQPIIKAQGAESTPPMPPVVRFCFSCGFRFYPETARFCAQCGQERLNLS